MGKFHDDGTLEIGGFGGEEIAEESSTVQEMDNLKKKCERLEQECAYLRFRVQSAEAKSFDNYLGLKKRIVRFANHYHNSLKVIAISLVAFSILNLALSIARLFI